MKLEGWLPSQDCLATLQVLQLLGVWIRPLTSDPDVLVIEGVGLHGLSEPKTILNFGNSGTGLRLMTGVLAAQSFNSQVTGDASLRKRPMSRLYRPLNLMGASISTVDGEYAPLLFSAVQVLRPISYELQVPSAQVISALQLASLYVDGKSQITIQGHYRDHTERLIKYLHPYLHKNILSTEETITIKIPGDISSAAFFMVAATLIPGSMLMINNVGVNLTRTGVIDILRQMGAKIIMQPIGEFQGESVAKLLISSAFLIGIDIPVSLVSIAIDELPIIAIAAACAKGQTRIRSAYELREKESDRIQSIANGLKILGISVTVFEDGLDIVGGKIKGGEVLSFGDHRIAMAFAIAGAVGTEPVTILNTDNVKTSFPSFVGALKQLGIKIKVNKEKN